MRIQVHTNIRRYIGVMYPLQLKACGVALDVNKKYMAYVDWSADVPLLGYKENHTPLAKEIGTAMLKSKEIHIYLNLTCWDILLLLEDAVLSHTELGEEYCIFDTLVSKSLGSDGSEFGYLTE